MGNCLGSPHQSSLDEVVASISEASIGASTRRHRNHDRSVVQVRGEDAVDRTSQMRLRDELHRRNHPPVLATFTALSTEAEDEPGSPNSDMMGTPHRTVVSNPLAGRGELRRVDSNSAKRLNPHHSSSSGSGERGSKPDSDPLGTEEPAMLQSMDHAEDGHGHEAINNAAAAVRHSMSVSENNNEFDTVNNDTLHTNRTSFTIRTNAELAGEVDSSVTVSSASTARSPLTAPASSAIRLSSSDRRLSSDRGPETREQPAHVEAAAPDVALARNSPLSQPPLQALPSRAILVVRSHDHAPPQDQGPSNTVVIVESPSSEVSPVENTTVARRIPPRAPTGAAPWPARPARAPTKRVSAVTLTSPVGAVSAAVVAPCPSPFEAPNEYRLFADAPQQHANELRWEHHVHRYIHGSLYTVSKIGW